MGLTTKKRNYDGKCLRVAGGSKEFVRLSLHRTYFTRMVPGMTDQPFHRFKFLLVYLNSV